MVRFDLVEKSDKSTRKLNDNTNSILIMLFTTLIQMANRNRE